jgi:hypothetical protein
MNIMNVLNFFLHSLNLNLKIDKKSTYKILVKLKLNI